MNAKIQPEKQNHVSTISKNKGSFVCFWIFFGSTCWWTEHRIWTKGRKRTWPSLGMAESFFEKLLADIPGAWVLDQMFLLLRVATFSLILIDCVWNLAPWLLSLQNLHIRFCKLYGFQNIFYLFFKENEKVFIGPQPSGSQSQRTGEHPSSPHVEDSCATNPQHDTANFKNDSWEKKQESHNLQ